MKCKACGRAIRTNIRNGNVTSKAQMHLKCLLDGPPASKPVNA